ncbi:MAG: hypothetical protein K2X32_04275 [Phycisphaerales bacterium]|nr:hypothetical protein [Phycisphaerales bacterium]
MTIPRLTSTTAAAPSDPSSVHLHDPAHAATTSTPSDSIAQPIARRLRPMVRRFGLWGCAASVAGLMVQSTGGRLARLLQGPAAILNTATALIQLC